MDLLAIWRYDNYLRDLDAGAGFHFNSNQPRLHTAIELGERLWLISRVVSRNGKLSEYRLLAKLVITAKTVNPPGYQYGAYRVWGDTNASRYFRVLDARQQDIFELLRLIEMDGKPLRETDRSKIFQACQTIRAVRPSSVHLLEAFASQLPIETRAAAVLPEEKLEMALAAADTVDLSSLVEAQRLGYSEFHRKNLRQAFERNRQLAKQLYVLYDGRCQVTVHDSPVLYGVPTAEAHHIVYRSRGGEDALDNLVLLSPNLHKAIHASEAKFDFSKLAFVFSNGRVEPLVLNKHLHRRTEI